MDLHRVQLRSILEDIFLLVIIVKALGQNYPSQSGPTRMAVDRRGKRHAVSTIYDHR